MRELVKPGEVRGQANRVEGERKGREGAVEGFQGGEGRRGRRGRGGVSWVEEEGGEGAQLRSQEVQERGKPRFKVFILPRGC
jgi:hypothetical protein